MKLSGRRYGKGRVGDRFPMNNTINILLFDFSGTLSLEAVEFSRPENLVQALKGSGLAALGVTSTIFFWDEIVYPTWIEGSTTARGYQAVLVDRINALGLHAPGDFHPRCIDSEGRIPVAGSIL